MKIKKLIIDTNAFIARVPMWEYAEELYTIQEVIHEMKGSQARQYLDSFPIELKFKNPSPESIKFINDFTKKTGDYLTLSLVDTKLLALTYELEKEAHNDSSHLRTEPDLTKTKYSASMKPPRSLGGELPEGFYCPQKKKNENSIQNSDIVPNDLDINEDITPEALFECNKDILPNNNALPSETQVKDDTLDKNSLNLHNYSIEDNSSERHLGNMESETNLGEANVNSQFDLGDENWSSETEEESDIEDCSDEDDDEGWITPGNIHTFSKSQNMEELANIKVACMTTDYAMQNTLRHIGLEVIGFDGKLMKQMKTYTLRCFACFKTTNKMDKIFCPFCGHKTLRKVTVSIDENGEQKIWLSTKYLLNTRGTKYPIPAPRGGKDAVNPVLVADQRITKQKLSKKTLKKMNMDPLSDNYVAGDRPFGVRDVFSKFAQLGITPGRNHRGTYYFEQRNPNEVKRSTVRMKRNKK